MRRRTHFHATDISHEESQINLTPLIDVVFVVLIMFILIAPILELDRINLASAAAHLEKTLPSVSENSAIAVHVRADNSIWFENRRITEEQLVNVLRQAKIAHPNKIPQLYHDKKATFGTYQQVKNAFELAGFQELDVILQPG